MKRPIAVADVLPGDTVERHWLGTVLSMPVARVSNGLLYSPEDYCLGVGDDADLYLLDRPTPPVELPTEPTLAYVSGDWSGPSRLAVWLVERDSTSTWLRPVDNEGDTDRTVGAAVTSFTPATAVPTEALNRLRHQYVTRGMLIGDVKAFLADVAEANGGAS